MTGLVEEIKAQPQALHNTLDDLGARLSALGLWTEKIQSGAIKRIVFVGMGSSFFAVQPAINHLSGHGITAIPIDASELLYYHTGLLDEQTLVVAISQSGESVEIRKFVEAFGASAPLIGITNHPDSTLARLSDSVLYMKAGEEKTVASKTYTCTLAVLHLMARALVGEDPAPAVNDLRQMADAINAMLPVWEAQTSEMVPKVEPVQALIYLGRGPSLASAMTGALITKETAKFPAEGMSSGQYRHGPIEATSPKLGVCIFAGGRMRDLNLGLARDLSKIGGQVIVVGDSVQSFENVLGVDLPASDEAVAPIAEIVPIQLFAAKFAESRGVEPGKFYYGDKVTTQE